MSSNSTTPYRNFTNAEFLIEVESRLGKSPVIDEMAIRLEQFAEDDTFLDVVETEIESLWSALASVGFDLPIRPVDPKVMEITLSHKCKVCEALTKVVVDTRLLPE